MHSSLTVFNRELVEFARLKAEAEKRGLGSCIELKFCRLEKGKDGSKAFAINTQERWDEERQLGHSISFHQIFLELVTRRFRFR